MGQYGLASCLDEATATAQAGLDAARGSALGDARRPLEVLGDVALLRGDLPRALHLYGDAHARAVAAGDLVQAAWDRGSAALTLVYGNQEPMPSGEWLENARL